MSINWHNYFKNLPWVCGVKTFNSESTIFACLQAASKTFKNIIITDDGSTDNTFNEIKSFIEKHKDINIKFFNVDNWDPIPELKVNRDHGENSNLHPLEKTHSKAQIKNYEVCKKYFLIQFILA